MVTEGKTREICFEKCLNESGDFSVNEHVKKLLQ